MTLQRSDRAFFLLALGLAFFITTLARAQGIDLIDRPISDIRVEGLKSVPETLVRNAIRAQKGDPYKPPVVQEDVVRITHLGRFGSVQARVEPQKDGSVVLIYVVTEQPLLADVQVVGNKQLTDAELLKLAVLRAGDPIDPFLIDRAIKQMKAEYEKKGYFITDISVDETRLKEDGLLIFRVREGPLVQISDIKFEGNKVFTDDELSSRIKSKTKLLILRKGELSRDVLEADAARLRDFYRERGYLDAQVGRRIDLSPDQKDAVVTFIVSEGKLFTVDTVKVEGNLIFGETQIKEAMALKEGDVFSAERLKASEENLINLYGKLGFIETRIRIDRLFHENEPKVDVRVLIDEGHSYKVGQIVVTGNEATQQKVILRQVRNLEPGRVYDREGIAKTEERLKNSPLFSDATVTVLGNPGDIDRDLLIEVKETNTGSLRFGAGVSSDAGVIGSIDLTQRNFDIGNPPNSLGELFSGKAFRGAGQYFALSLQPGNEFQNYSVSFREPYLLDSSYFMDARLYYFDRVREQWDERRIGLQAGIGQRFGDSWEGAIRGRAEQIDIRNIESPNVVVVPPPPPPTTTVVTTENAPTDIFAVEGNSFIMSIGPVFTRNTTDSRVTPSRGSVLEVSADFAGPFGGGDYTFERVSADFKKFWTVDEDFYGHKSIVSLHTQIGYIFGEAPTFERFYAGGHRSFRGFEFRGVGPRGVRKQTEVVTPPGGAAGTTTTFIPSDDPVGGNFIFLFSPEYKIPVYEDIVSWVFFVDTGTVDTDFNFSNYRVSIGTGIRLLIPFLGKAPFALDIAYPILKQEGDQTQFFSFDLDIPF